MCVGHSYTCSCQPVQPCKLWSEVPHETPERMLPRAVLLRGLRGRTTRDMTVLQGQEPGTACLAVGKALPVPFPVTYFCILQ